MNLMERMVEQARANKQRIVLPEGTEERTLQAADRIFGRQHRRYYTHRGTV